MQDMPAPLDASLQPPSARQIIYVLENEAMPGFLKIGRTSNVVKRVSELSANSAIPLPFTCTYAAVVEDAVFVEQQIHAAFEPHRVTSRREFFRVPPECVIAALELVAIEDVTPGAADEESDCRPRRTRTFTPDCYNKDMAADDVQAMLDVDSILPSQATLGAKWGVTKGTVTKWLDSFADRGMISRHRVGGRVMNAKAGLTVDEAYSLFTAAKASPAMIE